MTLRQTILKFTYPLLMIGHRKHSVKDILLNEKHITPPESFYSLKAPLINGDMFDFSTLAGTTVLLVNVASNCGYTAQYAELEKLYQRHRNQLQILGFPSNDFKGQEPGTEEEIAAFCKMNFGVSFPLFKKISVLNSQNDVYNWLSQPSRNGWNSMKPGWNFCKYLVDEKGSLAGFFSSTVSPLSAEIISKL